MDMLAFSNLANQDIAIRLIASAVIFIVSLISAKIAVFVLEKYVKKIAMKTETDVDDNLVIALKSPVYISLIAIGINISMGLLLENYSNLFILATKIILILTGFWFFSRAASILTKSALKNVDIKKDLLNEHVIDNLSRLLKLSVLAIGFIFALGEAGIEITPLLASAGILSLAVAFAAQESLSNLISGASLAISKPFRIGDILKIDNEYGKVESMTLRHTVIRLWDNRRMIIPNSL